MNRKVELLILALVLLVATSLRLWNFANVPPSPDWDEAALAYSAHSIILTGKDEYGKFLPVILQSFDDYKPALYAYLAIPSVLAFGVNTFAVRLPSAIMGILTVLATYFLVKELFGRWEGRGGKLEKEVGSEKDHPRSIFKYPASHIALLTSFLLAISPWHIQLSRIAFETNVGLAFNVFAALFFVKGLKKPWLLSLSVLSLVLGIYVYQSEKVFAPLFVLLFVVIFRKEFFALPKKYIVTAVIVGVITVAPMAHAIITDKNALMRAKGVSVFTEQTPILRSNLVKLTEDKESGNMLGQIFHNRRVVFAKEIASGYLSHYNLNWYFIKGDLMRHHAPNMAMLYLWELPFLLIGIYFLIFGPFSKKTKLFVFAWFLIAPIPASVTTGVPHAVRTLNFLPTFQIFTAIGLLVSLSAISNFKFQIFNFKLKYAIYTLFFIFVAFNFVYYLNQYFVQQNYYHSKEWQYGYAQIIPEIQKIEHKYSKIVVTNKSPIDQSFMFFLFYLKFPPEEYQNAGNKTAGFREVIRFGKYEFRNFEWGQEADRAGKLYMGRTQDFPANVKPIKTVNYLDGTPAIYLVEGK